MADGGFGKVYKAVWEPGPLTNFDPVAVNNHPYWNITTSDWNRTANSVVAVKKIKKFTSGFWKEVNQ